MPTKIINRLRRFDSDLAFEIGRQRVVKRNWRFSLLPFLAFLLSLAVLVWEVIRQNVDSCEWPWTLALLGVGPSAALTGLFASLLLAREQYAESMRPHLSWAARVSVAEGLGKEALVATLMNAGPGIAEFEEARFSMALSSQGRSVHEIDVPKKRAIELLTSAGLVDGEDFHFRRLTRGAPLPVVKTATEGIEFAAFTQKALRICEQLTFSVQVIDTMGDVHVKTMPFALTVPPKWRVQGSVAAIGGPIFPNSNPGKESYEKDR